VNTALRTMGDLFARHQARIATSAPPPAPASAPRAARLGISGRVERIARGEGWEFRVNGQRVATVTPGAAGFVVANIEAGHRSPPLDARQAEALAARIARLAALPGGKGEA
jgi:hypothetical protein